MDILESNLDNINKSLSGIYLIAFIKVLAYAYDININSFTCGAGFKIYSFFINFLDFLSICN